MGASLDIDNIYERYGRPLEQGHHGEYVAITEDGRTIVGKDDLEVVEQAMREFGSGNFVLCRVGYRYVNKVRQGTCWSAGASSD
jgi:hypothetical protein